MKLNTRARRILLVLLGWAALSLFFTAIKTWSSFNSDRPFIYFLYSNTIQCAFWVLIFPVVAHCVKRFPLDQEARFTHAVTLVCIAMILAVVLGLAYLTIWFFTIRSLLSPGRYPTLSSLLDTALFRFIQVNLLFELVLVLGMQVWSMWRNFQAAGLRAVELERQLVISQLETLRMQLHPHFLFNTLHTISSLITDEPAAAQRMVVSLGDFLRRTLNSGSATVRTLAEEMEFADLYMGIEQFRLAERLIVNYDIDPEAVSAEVPYLLLQPLFENALRHGVARVAQPCQIRFTAHRRNGSLDICLENDGPLCAESPRAQKNGIGLANTIARLRLHYGKDFSFDFKQRPQGGALVQLSIPYRKPNDQGGLYANLASTHSDFAR